MGCHFLVFHRERCDVCVVVLPSLCSSICFDFLVIQILLSGRLHRRGVVIYYSRSPLSEPDDVVCYCVAFVQMSGRLHRVEMFNSTLVLPSVFLPSPGFTISCRGDYTGEILFNSRSPPCDFAVLCILMFLALS